MDTIFVLIIFCVFAVSVLMVLMFGARTYENVTEMTREGYPDRSVLSYIWTKVKNSDESGHIYVGDFHGLPTLFIEEVISDTRYLTTIYHFDGWVYELFCEAELIYDSENGFVPEDGVQIVRLDDLTFDELEYGLIRVSSDARNLLIFPRGYVPDMYHGVFSYEGGVP